MNFEFFLITTTIEYYFESHNNNIAFYMRNLDKD